MSTAMYMVFFILWIIYNLLEIIHLIYDQHFKQLPQPQFPSLNSSPKRDVHHTVTSRNLTCQNCQKCQWNCLCYTQIKGVISFKSLSTLGANDSPAWLVKPVQNDRFDSGGHIMDSHPSHSMTTMMLEAGGGHATYIKCEIFPTLWPPAMLIHCT